MQVVVILKKTDDWDGDCHVEVYGVYRDLKSFYDEIKDKDYEYSDEHQCWCTEDDYGYPVYFTENIQNIIGVSNE